MDKNETRLIMLTEHSLFMMSFVFLTREGRALVIDGGRPSDMPYLFEAVGDREIAAWILTHPHMDHISGFVDAVEKGACDRRLGRVYCSFPSAAFVLRCEPDEEHTILDFERIRPRLGDRLIEIRPGMTLRVDEITVDFLFVGGERYEAPKPNLAVNESSCAFRVTAPGARSVLFLGDLGPEGGRDLLRACGDGLRSDIVQMSHHGHSGVTKEVYERIAPKACLWCAPDWLWDEEETEFEPELWGTRRTRRWMDEMGVKEHYVTKDGTREIPLQ